jgi:hypothetical protein
MGLADRSSTPKARRAALLERAFDHVLSEYGGKDYAHWRNLIGKDPITLPHPTEKDVEIEISPIWDVKPDGLIRVLVSILHATRFGISLPTTSFLIDPGNGVQVPPGSPPGSTETG